MTHITMTKNRSPINMPLHSYNLLIPDGTVEIMGIDGCVCAYIALSF